jgi:hypothetical protein
MSLPRLGRKCDCLVAVHCLGTLLEMTRLDLQPEHSSRRLTPPCVNLPYTRRVFVAPCHQWRVCGASRTAAALWHNQRVYMGTPHAYPNIW